jgi:hypothetical protein
LYDEDPNSIANAPRPYILICHHFIISLLLRALL